MAHGFHCFLLVSFVLNFKDISIICFCCYFQVFPEISFIEFGAHKDGLFLPVKPFMPLYFCSWIVLVFPYLCNL